MFVILALECLVLLCEGYIPFFIHSKYTLLLSLPNNIKSLVTKTKSKYIKLFYCIVLPWKINILYLSLFTPPPPIQSRKTTLALCLFFITNFSHCQLKFVDSQICIFSLPCFSGKWVIRIGELNYGGTFSYKCILLFYQILFV